MGQWEREKLHHLAAEIDALGPEERAVVDAMIAALRQKKLSQQDGFLVDTGGKMSD